MLGTVPHIFFLGSWMGGDCLFLNGGNLHLGQTDSSQSQDI